MQDSLPKLNKVYEADCLEEMKTYPVDSIDLIATDPPYGLEFMGKDWDKAVPSVEIWKETLRILKPGAFMFVMSAPRQDVQQEMIKRIQEAGFRMDFTPLYWAYASGFPKAGNISKMVDKRLGAEREVVGVSPNWRESKRNREQFGSMEVRGENAGLITNSSTPQAKALDGSYAGFQPKPAVEVILVAMKPLSEKTFVDQALKNKKGVTWLDDCRIPYEGTLHTREGKPGSNFDDDSYEWKGKSNPPNPQGRFPANLLISDGAVDDGKERKAQAGIRRNNSGIFNKNSSYGFGDVDAPYDDTGSFFRYFDLDKWAQKTFPFLIVPKASKGEKNEGLVDSKFEGGGEYRPNDPDENTIRQRLHGRRVKGNFHPTAKPVQLMSYLITLGSRPDDIVLDPFIGSGTTGIAARLLRRHFIGIEKNPEYVKIARARIRHIPVRLDMINI